ncbi:40S RIBOSOMAL PROTEIN SA or P40 [Encephalitozoon cuniculi GB-M1]|uniref:Small ribosomal subunit protein uS2 n=2 Tax=Encephalitozoon cuniculi TaxID=6035 RepID=RSSA_ENCCU|nr:40S ribosomal protein SA [Encephalitozoon cuniculi GB-M1]Q8SS60.1 RecName: Full=Small ribosomal subunit protein uS2; AltName: Full=40S ribosomal protein S0 [Encephalitozoon cuniculi GB-M1]7QEP_S0 Chain S0, 40S ribosomal protein S0 [Encephalitozoon cuniculi GB-M1]AGE95282.1 40S ribosomal protein SA [Encephalitozoon cuniculi]KMV66246.1 40S ribosomal protein SA [Encephalitozoon cuniculi EcunIII-L]UYI27420.1 ribosomal protein S0/S2/SA [Encephalitozoon cuniculi]CAD25232.1 40S RIBOSOMAL PROTEIN 
MPQDNTRISDSIKIPDEFVKLLIVSQSHLGGTSTNKSFARYLYGTRPRDRINIIDINATWEKLIIAARAFCGIKHPSSIAVVSTKTFGRKPVVKFCEAVGATPITGRFIPGSFTNSEVKRVYDPRVLIVSDTYADKQAILESQYCNLPTIAFVNTDNSLVGVDIAIPMNNRSPSAIAAGFFILSRLINYMKTGAELVRDMKEVELFLFRDSVELEQLVEEQLLETTDSILNVGKEGILSGIGTGNADEWNSF